ncbi:MAG TPA: GlsB/YeaQ/YmgE family stress response membrane protein [Ktedonobacteraceae bacterium]|nr:GlsB/YeaQ/YmgE family stress response membrane protein [Ktedonobacteraceae bacterium]
MSITQLLIWLIIAAVIGFIGELIARRHAPDGILGAIIVGFIAIVLIVGVFHFHIPGEPILGGVPLISSIIVAAILVVVWSAFAYRRVRPYYSRSYRRGGSTYRRGGYVRRPRRRRLF